MSIDARGRLIVPMWLRGGPSPSYLIGTRADSATVIVVPAAVLEALGEDLAGDQQP
jgi:hypothetical protein